MIARSHPSMAVLITGAYGSGKSSVAIEIADILESKGVRYALLDLDYLIWGYPGAGPDATANMRDRNLRALVENFVDAGVTHFILAGLVEDAEDLSRIRDTTGTDLKVVRLQTTAEAIRKRLAMDPNGSRQVDLAEAEGQLRRQAGGSIADVTVSNDGTTGAAAAEILDWLGWRDS